MDPLKRANVWDLWDEPFIKISIGLEKKGHLVSWLKTV